MIIYYNGQKEQIHVARLTEWLQLKNLDQLNYLAVSVNGTVIPKGRYEQVLLSDGDTIDIFSPAGGG